MKNLIKIINHIYFKINGGKFNKLLDIDFFLHRAILESGLNIYLFKILIQSNNKNKDNFIIYRFYYKGETFIIIQAFLLFETANDLTGFIPQYSTYDTTLQFIDFFTA